MATIQDVSEEISIALDSLRKWFRPECQLTFIMRLPGMPSAGLIVTKDEIAEVIKQLEYLQSNGRPVK